MDIVKKRLIPAIVAVGLALTLGACSKCDAAGWLKSCGATNAPKAIALPF